MSGLTRPNLLGSDGRGADGSFDVLTPEAAGLIEEIESSAPVELRDVLNGFRRALSAVNRYEEIVWGAAVGDPSALRRLRRLQTEPPPRFDDLGGPCPFVPLTPWPFAVAGLQLTGGLHADAAIRGLWSGYESSLIGVAAALEQLVDAARAGGVRTVELDPPAAGPESGPSGPKRPAAFDGDEEEERALTLSAARVLGPRALPSRSCASARSWMLCRRRGATGLRSRRRSGRSARTTSASRHLRSRSWSRRLRGRRFR
jgi:hypothetical protein